MVKLTGDIDGPPPPVDATDAIAILKAAQGVDDNGSYGAATVGSAKLTIKENSNDVQTSNFGTDSFKLTNTGDKQIAAVFVDFRDALYRDSVVDFDGTAGDTSKKGFAPEAGKDATGAITATPTASFTSCPARTRCPTKPAPATPRPADGAA